MKIFNRKKKQGSVTEFKLIDSLKLPFIPFGDSITKNDVVKVFIDRIATQCAKLKGRHTKTDSDSVKTEKKSDIAFVLKHKPNEHMTPYQFMYKVITLLFLNDNVFIYHMYDKATYKLKALYPLNPNIVEPIEDSTGSLFLRFTFRTGASYTLPYENVIHLKRFYGEDSINILIC